MCGIIGYWSVDKDAFPILFKSLSSLEYRGYDSFGFATLSNNNLSVQRAVGRISDSKCLPMSGSIGVGHTRWATHGGVSERNSHPHRDCSLRFAVAHNGIIENYQELRDNLISEGHNFLSETDTEVLSHYIEKLVNMGKTLKDSVIEVAKNIVGRNSFIVIDSLNKEIIACRNGSPLIVGIKNNELGNEVFVASDIPAFLEHTNNVMYLDDQELVVLSNNPQFFSIVDGSQKFKRVITIDWGSKTSDKGDYDHFMLKEIMEQKETLNLAINQNYENILSVANAINNSKGVFFIGCGTAAKVCQTAEYLFSKIANRHVNFINASEFSSYKNFLIPESLIIAVSQSGETADVLDALKIAKSQGSRVISIVNNIGSSMTRVSDYTFLINAGPEKAVASTKATTSQLAVIMLLAFSCAGKLGDGKRVLIDLIGKVNDMLNPRYGEHIKSIAKNISHNKNIFIIGRGINYPIALESAIKIMEVSYIHAQGFAGGELKHGPIALVEKDTPVIVLVSNDTKDEILSNAMEVKSRGAIIIGISHENNEIFDYWIRTPSVFESVSSIINLIPIQLLAYYLGLLNGRDIDKPRNLAKSVTVK